ncbi:MAG: hypothetical protein R6U98_09985 [Pirellulaceae bacterium]
MERCPTQAVLPLVGLAADQLIRDRYNSVKRSIGPPHGPLLALSEGGGRERFWGLSSPAPGSLVRARYMCAD